MARRNGQNICTFYIVLFLPLYLPFFFFFFFFFFYYRMSVYGSGCHGELSFYILHFLCVLKKEEKKNIYIYQFFFVSIGIREQVLRY